MTKLKLSSKFHILIIVSAIIIAIGLAVGLACHFTANGFFNYGVEYSSYKSVVVEYAYIDYGNEDEVKKICDEAFDKAGVNYYTSTYGTTNGGGEFTFKFSDNVSTEKLNSAKDAIHGKLSGEQSSQLSGAYVHEAQTKLGGAQPLIYCAIAVASAMALHFLYFVIRYRLTMAFAAILADVHNLALFVALLAITRIPVGSAAIVFATLTVLLTMIGTCFVFDRMRKNVKKEAFAKLSVNEQVDTTAGESVVNVASASVAVTFAAAVILVLMSISALSATVIVSPVILAVIASISTVYGTLFFTPSVYSRFKLIGDNFKAKRKAAKKS